jgi:hypothetical protein
MREDEKLEPSHPSDGSLVLGTLIDDAPCTSIINVVML